VQAAKVDCRYGKAALTPSRAPRATLWTKAEHPGPYDRLDIVSEDTKTPSRQGLRSVASVGDSAVDRVTAEVRRAVLHGTLAPGATFSIAELSAQLEVSHIPVREALRRLEAQGLVILRPGRSAMVSPLHRDELRSIYRLRQLIEPDLAARSCLLLTPADLARAEVLLETYIAGGDDTDQLWASHHDLHMLLMRPAATEWDLRILAQLWHACDRYTRIVFDPYAVSEKDKAARHAAHRALLAAARSHSPAEARMAVSSHLSENEAGALEALAVLSADTRGEAAAPARRRTRS
jgi:DNA-binding GntR family transcriptional regulator